MEGETEEPPCLATAYRAIPFDLFVSKEYKRFAFRGVLRFTDSVGNLVYKVQKLAGNSDSCKKKLLLDSLGNTLLSLDRVSKGSWRGFRGEDLMFTAEKTTQELNRSEFRIVVMGGKDEESNTTELQMRGSPLKRSCTLYKDDSIVAETSLMYRLGFEKIFVPRSRFRVTIFPGFTDTTLVASLFVICFDGRKLWI